MSAEATLLSASGVRHRVGQEMGRDRFAGLCGTAWLFSNWQPGIRHLRDCKLCFPAPVDGAE